MALVTPAVAPFKWTVDIARELIRLRRDNHDDFEVRRFSLSMSKKMVLIKIWVQKSQEVGCWGESSRPTNNKPNFA
ncbi:6833_t:CDS:2 [Funneliformis geosporum]|uniref:6833_t:CDS:1 n=1 Tax=Funneliformis geosporum TaxID=1117311 RepID=A0A9W4T4H2_9GLOM|nr:6833_t:CDS:2 [Funneliformis geosporum]